MYLSNNITVDEMTGRGLISVRAMNICKRSRLFTFDSIYAHYKAYGTFTSLPFMGEKTNESLIRLCADNSMSLQTGNASDEICSSNKVFQMSVQPGAIIAAYQRIPESHRVAAEHMYGNLVCTLSRRAIRALFILYKSKSLAGLVNGLQIKPSAFTSLANAMLPKGADLNQFLNKLTEAISGDMLNDTAKEYKFRMLTQQIVQLTRKPDERITSFLKENIDNLETGSFPLADFISVFIASDSTVKSLYKNAVLSSDLFFKHGLPPSSRELLQKLGISGIKLRRLYQDKGAHLYLYKQVSNAIKILQTQGLITPGCFMLEETPYHFYPSGLSNISAVFTNRLLAPLFSFFNPNYRMFHPSTGENKLVLFVNREIESWFNTAAFFTMLEKKLFLKMRADDSYFLLQLLLPFCKHIPSEKQRDALFAFVKPVLLHLDEQRKPAYKSKPKNELIKPARRHLIYQFIKDKDRHCHVNEISAYLTQNGDTVSYKSLLKYLEKCTTIIKPVGKNLFQLREWDTYNRWQQETVLQLTVNFLLAYNEPKHIYTIGKHIKRYKNITLEEVADELFTNINPHFTVVEHLYFTLLGNACTLSSSSMEKIPSYWLDTASFLFTSAPETTVREEELVKFIMQNYKLTKAHSQSVVNIRLRLGDWKQIENSWLRKKKSAPLLGNDYQQQIAI